MTRLSKNIRIVTNCDGGVILDLSQGKIFRLNPTGATIVELLARGHTEDAIAEEIGKQCSIQASLASTDVGAFLASLQQNGLLHPKSDRTTR